MVSRWDLLCSYMIKKNKKPKSPCDKINVKAALDYLTDSSGMPNNVPHYPRLLRAEACHFIWITSSYYFSCRAFHFKQSDSRIRDKSVTALLQVVWFLWPFVIQPTLSVFWHDNSSKVIHIKKKKMSGAFEWTLKYFALEPVPFKQCFHIGVMQLPLNNLGEASNVLFGGDKKKRMLSKSLSAEKSGSVLCVWALPSPQSGQRWGNVWILVVGCSHESQTCPCSKSFIVNSPSGDPKLMNRSGISRGLGRSFFLLFPQT